MQATGDIGIYIHFPFCRRRCPYCDFRVDVADRIPHRRYADAVLEELSGRTAAPLRQRRLVSLYFGGGTPSLWHPDAVARVIEGCLARFPRRAAQPEITLEANPRNVSPAALARLRAAGVNRLSLGVQSFHPATLRRLGRDHSASRAAASLTAAVRVMPAVSFDLICGVPGQTAAHWEAELDAAERFADVDHVSVYELTYHPNTPFGRRLAAGRIHATAESRVVGMLEATVGRMAAAGRQHYEVSNYARVGAEAVHNALYWHGGEVIGLGVGAHSMQVEDTVVVRRENVRQIAAYLVDPLAPPAHLERLSARDHLRERLFLGLRTSRGVDLDALVDQLGTAVPDDAQAALEWAVEAGLLQRQGPRFRPTERGMLFADTLGVELVAPTPGVETTSRRQTPSLY